MRSEKAFAVTNTGDIKMSGKFLARASALSLAVFFAACGGGDDGSPLSGLQDNAAPDANGGGTTADPTPPTQNEDPNTELDFTVGSLRLSASPVQMGTSENSEATI